MDIVIGAIVSLVSVVVTAILTHILDMRKLRINMKNYPSKVLYDKQTEFFDKLIPVLDRLNGYIAFIDVWLGENSDDAPEKVRQGAKENQCVGELNELIEKYHFYVPKDLLDEANELWARCIDLSSYQNTENTNKCINLFFKFQNSIRKFVGVEELSSDLLKAFGTKKEKVIEDDK